jgi:hypothetical protein
MICCRNPSKGRAAFGSRPARENARSVATSSCRESAKLNAVDFKLLTGSLAFRRVWHHLVLPRFELGIRAEEALVNGESKSLGTWLLVSSGKKGCFASPEFCNAHNMVNVKRMGDE